MRCHTLFRKDNHIWLIFCKNSETLAEYLPLNHHVLCAGASVTLIDPGGISDFPLYLSNLSQQISLERVNRIILTSLDVTATCSLSLWLQALPGDVQVIIPSEARDRLLHLNLGNNIKTIAPAGEELSIEDGSVLKFLPANHLYSPVGFSVFDSGSQTLYSGIIGQNSFDISLHDDPFLTNFQEAIPSITKFHDSWFPNIQARKTWVALAKNNNIDFLAPLTGGCLQQKEAIQFLDFFITKQISKPKLAALAPKNAGSLENKKKISIKTEGAKKHRNR